ncbi:DUF3993 domain-containing protein [Priestia aryabhattai]|uniref:DUF3993 domain-containing protein n=1 Tax=Priestia megaterium TaxID=1404 RepID=UPI0039B90587
MKKVCLLVFLLIISYSGKSVHAEVSGEIRHKIFTNLQDAYQAQLRFASSHHNQDAARELKLFLDDKYASMFFNEALLQKAQGYVGEGPEYLTHYIPFFSFDEQTKVALYSNQNKAYVYQFFPSVHNERVKYQDHYEMITLVKKQGVWKVQKFIYSK